MYASGNWGERSEPHTCGENGKLSIYFLIYSQVSLYIYIYIYKDTWLVVVVRLSGCHSSVAEHWLHKPGVLGSIPSGCWPFHFPLFSPHNI